MRPLVRSVSRRYQSLGVYGKITICLLLLFYACVIALVVLVTPSRIAQFAYDFAAVIRRLPYGYFILIAAIVLMSFPPFIGYSMLLNVCGFTYGMRGLIPASIATVGGSALVFFALRSLFGDRLRRWSAANDNWKALEAVIRAKGLPLIILIRVAPFPPWVYSNSLFASIESVSLTQFVFATLFVLPRAAVHVFVGSRVASLSDGEQRSHMDATTMSINGALIVGGIATTAISSAVVYYLVRKEIALLQNGRVVAHELHQTPEVSEEEAPFLAGF